VNVTLYRPGWTDPPGCQENSPEAGFPFVEVKLAPLGKFEAESVIASGSLGLDALIVNSSGKPMEVFAEPGADRSMWLTGMLDTLRVTCARNVTFEESTIHKTTV